MITKQLITLSLIAGFVSGCSTLAKFDNEQAPADFVIEQDSTNAISSLSELNGFDHQIIFERGQTTLSEDEQARILAWIQTEQPTMIGVRGTGGAERHRDLGNSRAATIIEFIQSQNIVVDAVLLDYNAQLLGGRGLISIIPDSLAAQIKSTAPILIISSN